MTTTRRHEARRDRDVESARAKLDELEAARMAAEGELGALQEGAGDQVLDDPSAAARVVASMAELRAKIDLSTRAITAQHLRIESARLAYFAAAAEGLEAAVEQAREALEKHNKTTARLLKQLESHEGEYVPAEVVANLQRSDARGYDAQPRTRRAPTSRTLQRDVAVAEKRVWVMRELAAGRDPHPTLQAQASVYDGTWDGTPIESLYTAGTWGPGAVVPAPAYVLHHDGAVTRAHGLLNDLLTAQATLETEIEEWTERDRLSDAAAPSALARRRQRLEELPDEIAAARNQLAALTGTH
jgi:hypothetical protein